jgi:hypothetical protein
MNEKEGVMAAILAAIDQFEQEQVLVAPAIPRTGMSYWKYRALREVMRMRISWQLRIYAPAPLRRR